MGWAVAVLGSGALDLQIPENSSESASGEGLTSW